LEKRGADLGKLLEFRCTGIGLHDVAADLFDLGDSIGGTLAELPGRHEHEVFSTRRHESALEARIGRMESADPSVRRHRTRTHEAAVDVHPRDELDGVRVDAT